MPFEVSDFIIVVFVVFGLVVIGWIIAKILDRRNDVLHHVNRENHEP
jgi:hypothetical protein